MLSESEAGVMVILISLICALLFVRLWGRGEGDDLRRFVAAMFVLPIAVFGLPIGLILAFLG